VTLQSNDKQNYLFHPTCFQCSECGKNLVGKKHVEFKQKPWCTVCLKQIYGDVDPRSSSDEEE
jgi:transposase-like protein